MVGGGLVPASLAYVLDTAARPEAEAAAALALDTGRDTRSMSLRAAAPLTNAKIERSRGNPYRIDPESPWYHVANVSGGRSSAFMLERLLDAHGGELPPRCEAIFANTGKERAETLDFVAALTERWGVPITWLEYAYVKGGKPARQYRIVSRETASLDGEPFSAMLDAERWMPSTAKGGRVCTAELKVGVIDRYLWQTRKLTRRQTRKLIGFRADEPHRWKPALYEACEVAYPMVDAGVTAGDVAAFWGGQAFDLGIDSSRGNCDLCYLKARPNLVATIRDEPSRADWWMDAERRSGRTFRIGESFEALKAAALAPNDTGEISGGDVGDADEPLPCFCTD